MVVGRWCGGPKFQPSKLAGLIAPTVVILVEVLIVGLWISSMDCACRSMIYTVIVVVE